MIVRCPDCLTKYEIAAGRVPEEGMRVRCPKCKAVFPVTRVGGEDRGVAAASRPELERAETVATGAAAPAYRAQPALASAAVADGNGGDPGGRGRTSRPVTDPAVARRLARAILQEMLLTRREEHARAAVDGTLLSRFGADLLAGFALYEEKVSPELPGAAAIYREAAEAILGDERPLF